MHKILSVLCLSFLLGCGVTEKKEESTLILTPEQLADYSSKGGTQKVTVSTNQSFWEAEVEAGKPWCSIDKDGNVLTVSASLNDSGDGRQAKVTVSTVDQSRVLTVNQPFEASLLELSPSTLPDFEWEASGGTSIEVDTDYPDWTVEVENGKTWCKVIKESAKFTIELEENNTYYNRTAQITVSALGVSKVIDILQYPKLISSYTPDKQYPSYGFVADWKINTLVESDYQYLAQTHRYLHGGPSDSEKDKLRGYDPDFKILQYINNAEFKTVKVPEPDDPTESKIPGYIWVETYDYHNDIAYHCSSLVEGDVTVDQDYIILKNGSDPFDRLNAVVASSSEDCVLSASKTQYCVWLKTEKGELMRIKSVIDVPEGKKLQVERGFKSTTAYTYQTGDKIFMPVYQSNAVPGSNNMGYSSDPNGRLRKDVFILQYKKAMNDGYDGVWNDVFEASVANSMADAAGNKIQNTDIWSFVKGGCFTPEEIVAANKKSLNESIAILKNEYGVYPTIAANNFGASHRGVLDYFEPYEGQNALVLYNQEITVVDNPDIFSQWENNKTMPVLLSFYTIKNPSQWKSRKLDMLAAIEKGYPVGTSLGPAGTKARMFECLEKSERDSIERFHYAGYLMVVDRNKTVSFATAAMEAKWKSNEQVEYRRPYKLDDWFFPIGLPVANTSIDLSNVQKGNDIYAREFENGYVIINTSTSSSGVVTLPDNGNLYYDPLAQRSQQEAIKTVTLNRSSAKILLKIPQ